MRVRFTDARTYALFFFTHCHTSSEEHSTCAFTMMILCFCVKMRSFVCRRRLNFSPRRRGAWERKEREKRRERESKKGKNQKTKKKRQKIIQTTTHFCCCCCCCCCCWREHNNARVFFFSFVREEEELTCITECIDTWFWEKKLFWTNEKQRESHTQR